MSSLVAPVRRSYSSGSSQSKRDTHHVTAATGTHLSHTPTTSGSSQNTVDTQWTNAATGTNPKTSGSSHCRNDTQQAAAATGTHVGGYLRDPILGVLADVVTDLETVRIANSNRVRIFTRNEADGDGEERGFGLTEEHPEVKKLMMTVDALAAAEWDAISNMQRALRKHPLIGFQRRHKGVGEKQLARLLAVIGDPYWNDLYGRPRTVSELWAFCGFHVINSSGSSQRRTDTQATCAATGTNVHPTSQGSHDTQSLTAGGVAPKRTRGHQSNWSEDARKRVWVMASAMPKFPGGTYERVYRDGRVKYADAKHSVECVRCGPKGKPAKVGSDLSDGHKHARAVRLTAKAMLKDLWVESRDLYLAG